MSNVHAHMHEFSEVEEDLVGGQIGAKKSVCQCTRTERCCRNRTHKQESSQTSKRGGTYKQGDLWSRSGEDEKLEWEGRVCLSG